MRFLLILVSLLGVSLAHADQNATAQLDQGQLNLHSGSRVDLENLEDLEPAENFGAEMDMNKFLGLYSYGTRDRVNERCDRRGRCRPIPGRPGRPGYPGRPGRPGYPPPSRPGYPPPRTGYYECFAEDSYGYRYRAVDYDTRRGQEAALDECYRYDRYCYKLGCRRY